MPERLTPGLGIGACLVAILAVLVPTTVAAQIAEGRSERSDRESIVRQWELRGVVIADAERLAVLEHRSSGRQQVLRAGDALGHGVSMTTIRTIRADRVVLDSEGTAVTLRLGHGGQARVALPAGPVRPRWLRTIPGRTRGPR